jgi:hypothetical protein
MESDRQETSAEQDDGWHESQDNNEREEKASLPLLVLRDGRQRKTVRRAMAGMGLAD